VRPTLASREELRVTSTLLVVLDGSESMSIQDEAGPRSRWEAMLRILRQAEPIVQKLHDEQSVNVVVYRFAEDAVPEDRIVLGGKADGTRTDFGRMLHAMYERHGTDRNLLGLLIISDGADNGV